MRFLCGSAEIFTGRVFRDYEGRRPRRENIEQPAAAGPSCRECGLRCVEVLDVVEVDDAAGILGVPHRRCSHTPDPERDGVAADTHPSSQRAAIIDPADAVRRSTPDDRHGAVPGVPADLLSRRTFRARFAPSAGVPPQDTAASGHVRSSSACARTISCSRPLSFAKIRRSRGSLMSFSLAVAGFAATSSASVVVESALRGDRLVQRQDPLPAQPGLRDRTEVPMLVNGEFAQPRT